MVFFGGAEDSFNRFFPLVVQGLHSKRMADILSSLHVGFPYVPSDHFHIDTIERLGERDDILKVFDPIMSASNNTRLVLKRPKTDSSVRRIWLPKTLAYILREWKNVQEAQKRFLGDEYQDYGLVVALENGRPSDNRNIEKSFSKLRETAGLPRVCFHSLRHSSTTYKLKLNHGDLKATQGDTGHAQVDMMTKIYAHILDEDRKVNAQKYESAFHSSWHKGGHKSSTINSCPFLK